MSGNSLKVTLTYHQISLYSKVKNQNDETAFNELIKEIGIRDYNRLLTNGYRATSKLYEKFEIGDILEREDCIYLIVSNDYGNRYNCVYFEMNKKQFRFNCQINNADYQFNKITDEDRLKDLRQKFALSLFTKKFNGFEVGDLVLEIVDGVKFWKEIRTEEMIEYWIDSFKDGYVHGFVPKYEKVIFSEDKKLHKLSKDLLNVGKELIENETDTN